MKIWVPMDSAARALGADEVASAIADEAAARGIEVEIIRNGSRGMIWLEPLVEIDRGQGREGFGPVMPADVPALLDGTLDSLGPVEDIPFFARQTRLTFARCGVIDPLSLSDYEAHGGLAGLRRAISMDAAGIVEEVKTSGLRGRGGAGFPTGIKWDTVRQAAGDRKYIVCNADEGDSGTFADRMIMEGDPFSLIEGMAIAALGVGASKGFVYLRSEYPDAIRVMNDAVTIARDAGVLGADVLGSGRAFDIEVRVGAGAYVCGEETSLLNSLEGKRGVVRAKPPLPAIEGLFGHAHGRQQRHQPGHGAGDLREGRAALRRLRAGPVARDHSDPDRRECAIRRAVRDRLRPEPCQKSCMGSAVARPRAGRSRRCRWAGRLAPISPPSSSTRPSATRNSTARAA